MQKKVGVRNTTKDVRDLACKWRSRKDRTSNSNFVRRQLAAIAKENGVSPCRYTTRLERADLSEEVDRVLVLDADLLGRAFGVDGDAVVDEPEALLVDAFGFSDGGVQLAERGGRLDAKLDGVVAAREIHLCRS